MSLTFGSLLLTLAPLQAEPQAPVGVALVLSGGGGRSLSQVGVLQVLEELHVPVDLVIGCEGGAVVGGLYATGRTPQDLARFFQGQDWLDAIEGREARRTLSWRRRVESRDFLFEVPVTLRHWSLALPRGLLRSRRLNQYLEVQAIDALGCAEFDELPIRFRAIATALESGEPVVLERALSSAMLASLATPVLLPPIEVEGRPLVSGAVSEALPIGIALGFEPAAMIVVDCTPEAGVSKDIEDALDVAHEVLTLQSSRRRSLQLRMLRPQDVLITPSLGELATLDYRQAEPAIAAGRRAALEALERLAPHALSQEAWAEHLSARSARQRELRVVRSIEFEDGTDISPAVLDAHVESEPGKKADPRLLAEDLERLYGLDLHERIQLALEEDDGEQADLVFRTRPALWDPLQLRVGGLIEGDLRGDASFALGIALNWRPLNGYGGEWRNRVEFGDRFTILSEYYQPLDARQRWFTSLSASWNERRVNLTVDEVNLAEYEVSWIEAHADVGRVLGEWGELRFGAQSADGRAEVSTGDPAVYPPVDIVQGGVRTLLSADTLDSTAFPREGHVARVEWLRPVDALGGNDEEYVRVDWSSAYTWGANTLAPGGMFGTALDDDANVSNLFPLGGFLRLSGFQRDELAGPHALLARLVGWHELGRQALERKLFSYYLGASLEAGNVFLRRQDIEAQELLLSSSLFLGVSTAFGPVYVGIGSTEGGRYTAFLSVGGQF